MKKFLLSFVIVAALLAVQSCSTGNSVSVRSFSPEGEVDLLTTFTISFTQDLAPADMQGEWLDDDFVEFDPPIEGKFKWTSANTLIFSPEQPLEPIQSYTAKITDKVLFASPLTGDFEEYSFNTPDFDVLASEFFWTNVPGKDFVLSVQANIEFNYPVNPDQLSEYIEVTRAGETISDFSVVSENSDDVIAVNFGEVQQTDREQSFSITVKEGLQSVIGKKPLAENRTFETDLPPITDLAITGVASGFDDNVGWIQVGTTQIVDKDELQKYVSITPPRRLNFFVQDNSFRIEADLDDLKSVTLKVKEGLPGLYGGRLQDEFEQIVSMVSITPSVNFTDKQGKYLMAGGERNLEVSAVNVDEVDITVSQVFRNNIVFFLSNNTYYYDYDYSYGYNPSYYVSNYGKELYSETRKLNGSQNWLEKFNVNMDGVLNQRFKGIYVVNVSSAKERWRNDSRIVAISDLGIIAKKSAGQLMVFVNSIASAEPVQGAEIALLSSTNQLLTTAVTDQNGVATVTDLQASVEDFYPVVITAEKGEDFNYIDLRETDLETSRYDVGGRRLDEAGYNLFAFGDRDLYRPGETAHITAILRDDKINAINGLPVQVKIITPRGRTLEKFQQTTDPGGSFELDVYIPDYAQTGTYTAEFTTAASKRIGSYRFSIEDFVPDKIRVMLNAQQDVVYPGSTVPIDLEAEFLFGAMAAGLRYEATMQMRHRDFVSRQFPRYDFSNSSAQESRFESETMDGSLDNDGKATLYYDVPWELSGKGIISGITFVSVFDLTGRPVNRAASFDIYPKDYFIGIQKAGYYSGVNEDVNFKIVAVNPDDEVIDDFQGVVTLVRYEWQTVLRENGGSYRYVSEKKEHTVWSRQVEIDGETDYTLQVDQSGDYELRVRQEGYEEYQAVGFYAYGWASASASTFEVDREGRIDIVSDKEKYEPGETANLLFTGPFSGKLLVTVERNGVYSYEYLDFQNRSAEYSLQVTTDHMPNVYVSATLFRPHGMDEMSPFLVGHGYHSITVEKEENRLPISIDAPDEIKPNQRVEITVETVAEKNVYMTIAAVDEGILQIKNYETPDPYGYMYAKRALETDQYDLYHLLLPEMIELTSQPGGDAFGAELQKRGNPIKSKRFKPLAVWSGIRKTDASGEVTLSLNVPQFNGEVRLMAVAWSGPRFGSGDKPMKVADDIILEPEIPRFLAPGDTLVSAVTVVNTTSSSGSVDLTAAVSGPLEIVGAASMEVDVDANTTAQALFTIVAKEEIGEGKITFTTTGKADVKEVIDIGVRPGSPLVVESGSGTIKGGESLGLEIGTGFMQGTQSSMLSISRFPAIKFADQLKALAGYPYGCVEQTVSKAFPQIYLDNLTKLAAPELYRTANPSYYVKQAVRKVESMQLYDGSLAYWQGGTYSSWWGSVYGAHFLIEAQKAGYSVSDDVLDNLLDYIETKAKEKSTYDYVYYTDNSRRVKKIANKEIPYSLYVLSLADRGEVATMNYYKARPHLLSTDGVYLLAGAYGLMNSWNAFHELLPSAFKPEEAARTTGGSFDSEVRANAIMLNVLLEVDPGNEQIQVILRYLSGIAGKMYSTQERAFFFLALGKAASMTSADDINVEVLAGGVKIAEFDGTDFTLTNDILSEGDVALKGSGSGEVYYFWSAEGIKLNQPVREEDSNMRVRRSYYDFRTGRPITDGVFRQGQLIVCKLSLTGAGRSAENIVISDLLPAAFEIENPRLSDQADLPVSSQNMIDVDYLDIRDDRLLLFTNLQANTTRDFFYMLRVINKGEYGLPPVGAEAMYDREYHSYNGAGTVVVKEARSF